MKKCKNCNVQVYDNEDLCPLCFNKLGDSFETAVEFPKYENLIEKKKILRNLPLFMALSTIIICVFIDIFTHKSGVVLWSAIVTASVLYVLEMYYVIRKHINFGEKILCSYSLLSLLLIIIDFLTGMLFWSTDYVFPFLTVATILYLTILAIRSKPLFSEYFGYIIAVTAISFSSVIMYLIGWNTNAWGPFVSIVSCSIIALGLYLFANKTLKEEINKRFHR